MSGSGLRLALLGPFSATLDGERLVKFRTIHVQALLAYLATEHVLAPGSQRREALTELLWPGMPSGSGRANLRQILYYLRQMVNGSEAIDFLLSDRHTIQVNPDYPLSVDLALFDELLAGPVEDQSEAVALYRGDFLA
ncbi:MAG: hypothetical protein R3300_15480, partial [Candidatus Promineifilaceae bacterium]|nr:hypothetical protein [Candidatus Promineifilaceae bacterium]